MGLISVQPPWPPPRKQPVRRVSVSTSAMSRVSTICLVLGLVAQSSWAQAGTGADTLNRTDDLGRKQGWWQLEAPMPDKPRYAPGQLVEEGRYLDNKRIGTWLRYWPNGRTQSQITYVLGRPKGAYKTWFEDGSPEEEGAWDLDRNVGNFKRWHPNGKLAQEFSFDLNGLRNGDQRYYRENGNLEAEVTVLEGREQGTLKRYYANGELEETVNFNLGEVDAASLVTHEPKGKEVKLPTPADAVAAPARKSSEATNNTIFKAEGWNTLYDMQHRLAQQGEYRNGVLWNGKVYKYDKNGLLTGVDIYAKGKYAGKGVLTEDDR